ncbi:pentatricopeptide repeat-containing protein At4g14170 [Magnolia sinica]|uniref:pentatricopeptide repeat-containing protein At4g14170 n=1 Tax=Magnolia sinica TaxID=86752 RepID=UPI002658397E|nr:pentatricopeptide repeat-containing protein At4g14170 [Magnolia sinica]XP_058079079.1 pentatricopeptide repeat-containing protein At4g14170 [Magnolia sinica]XP_058079080.1 pentatricopeptide repeat-containing protein At4g14170 [Magnolia sinica]
MTVRILQSTPKLLHCNLIALTLFLTHPYSTTPKSNFISYHFSLLHSSPNSRNLRHLHARLLRNGLYDDVILASKLILMYSKHHCLLPHSLSVFSHMPVRNVYSWSIIIGEFLRSGRPQRAFDLFVEMRGSGEAAGHDASTLPLALRACASLGDAGKGMYVHGLCVKVGLVRNVFVASAIVFFYVACSWIWDARCVFDEIPQRDAVLWTTMLGGYAQNGEPGLGLEVYREMVGQGIQLDWVVMVSLLLICSQLGWARHGKSVHGWSVRRCLGLGLSLGNALIDMYSKCGELACAHRVFDRMPVRDVISWSVLILGYGLNGCVGVASELFEQMHMEGVMPNSVTFLGVLSACCHAGMVEKAWSYLNMMKEYKVLPELKHYSCMVDVLARAGHLVEAERFIEEMPMKPDAVVLGALLAGCRVHGNIEVGERVAKRLLRLEPQKSGYYVLLANIYAAAGKFDEAERVRGFMKERNVGKVPGCSLIEADGLSEEELKC